VFLVFQSTKCNLEWHNQRSVASNNVILEVRGQSTSGDNKLNREALSFSELAEKKIDVICLMIPGRNHHSLT